MLGVGPNHISVIGVETGTFGANFNISGVIEISNVKSREIKAGSTKISAIEVELVE